MSNGQPKSEREAFDDVVIIIDKATTEKKIEYPEYPNDLAGTFELGDIADYEEISTVKGLGDMNEPSYGGELGMMMFNSES